MTILDAYKGTEKSKVGGGGLSSTILILLLYLSEIISSLKNIIIYLFCYSRKDLITGLSVRGFMLEKLQAPVIVLCDFRCLRVIC